jgi:hypothetical protein
MYLHIYIYTDSDPTDIPEKIEKLANKPAISRINRNKNKSSSSSSQEIEENAIVDI